MARTLKYDKSGTLKWKSSYPVAEDTVSSPNHIFLDSNGYLYIICQIHRNVQDPPLDSYLIQALKFDTQGNFFWDDVFRDDTKGYRISSACFGSGGFYVTGAISTSFPATFLLGIGTNGKLFSNRRPPDARDGREPGCALVGDDRGFVHVTGNSHFADTEGLYHGTDGTEIATLTYYHGTLLKERRYAGSPYLQSLGGRAIAVDSKDNIIVAGQTFSGQSRDIVVLRYPP